jgi:hypothetical protein
LTAWEYAFLYSVSTIPKPHDFQRSGPLVFVFHDATRRRILAKTDSLLKAFNLLGADGWIVQMPEVSEPTNAPQWIKDLVNPTLADFTVFQSWRYFVRRPCEPDSAKPVQTAG